MTATHVRAVPKEEYPQLDNYERRHVAVLHRRLGFLRLKLSSGNCSAEASSYIAAEISSLEWVLERAIAQPTKEK